ASSSSEIFPLASSGPPRKRFRPAIAASGVQRGRMSADLAMARSRAQLLRALRDGLDARGYLEVETPIAVPVAGQEPHLRPFETSFIPDAPVPPGGVVGRRRLHLHTSPEYAMKRLVARGFGRIWQMARVFRDGEVSPSHNPEFTLLELYAAPGDSDAVMADLEELVAEAARALRGSSSAPAREGHGGGAQRFGLYADGAEVANGFTELHEATEQRRRLEGEQRERARLGREVFPLDERFLSALPAMPDAGGVAVGVDRLLMLLTGAREIADVLSFPAAEEYPHARRT